MAFFSKEVYERKAEWAARRAARNEDITTLSKEQHDALEEISRTRILT